LLVLAACRAGFDPIGDPPAADASADAPVAPRLTECDPLAPALAVAEDGREPAMFTDDLTLLASSSGVLREAVRPEVGDPFDAFEDASLISASVGDPAFLDASDANPPGGLIRLATRSEVGIRRLVTCDGSTLDSCADISLFDEEGAAITDDVDGPYPAILDGQLIASFNRGDAVYLAVPRAIDLLEWDARLLQLDVIGSFDDPALTSDGETMFLFSSGVIFSLRYDRVSEQYVDPVLLIDASSPAVGFESATEIELFVTAETRGVVEPHRTVCRAPSE
jgi:hypothetical protein